MWNIKTMYACSVCSKMYEHEIAAKRCEQTHHKPVDVKRGDLIEVTLKRDTKVIAKVFGFEYADRLVLPYVRVLSQPLVDEYMTLSEAECASVRVISASEARKALTDDLMETIRVANKLRVNLTDIFDD